MTYGREHTTQTDAPLDGATVSHSAELVRASLCERAKAPSSARLAEGELRLTGPSSQGEKGYARLS